MYLKKVPDHLSVIVVSAKGLKPKKEGKGKFNVVFGIGSSKANTEPSESQDGSPVFNCEHEFIVPDLNAVLALKVVDSTHGEVLGQVLVPVINVLNLSREHIRTYPLQPYKKKKHVLGDLNLITWVTKWKVVREEDVTGEDDDGVKKSSALFNFSKVRGLLSSDKQKNDSRNLVTNPIVKKAFSSCNDLSIIGSSTMACLPYDSSLRSLDHKANEISRRPEVSGISPSEGPISGGTRLVVRGCNLGERREDVIGLFVCGSNILGSLEYISSSKLICTTKAWKPCTGNITIETQTGGRGSSLVQFTFVQPAGDFGQMMGKKCDGADDSGISLDGSLKKPKNSEESPKNNMAKSLFNLTNLTKRSDSFEGKCHSEISSISPKEALYNARTKLTIKGTNLGISRLDVLKIVVCGTDCTESVEFESPSKLVCFVGPVPKPTAGNIVIETSSGGTYQSSIELKLLPDKKETDRTANHDKYSSSSLSPTSNLKFGFLENIKRQHFSSISSGGDPAPSLQNSDNSRSTLPTGSKPPVVEVLPMTKSKRKEEVISVLEKKLLDSNREIEDLVIKNKKLNEECERLRDYMGLIVSRALVVCPQILSVD